MRLMIVLFLFSFLLISCATDCTRLAGTERNTCLTSLSVEQENISLCGDLEHIDNEPYKKTLLRCRSQHTYLEPSEVCEIYPDSRDMRACIRAYAWETQDAFLCESLKDVGPPAGIEIINDNIFASFHDNCLWDAQLDDCSRYDNPRRCSQAWLYVAKDCDIIADTDLRLMCYNDISEIFHVVTRNDYGNTQGLTADGDLLYLVGGGIQERMLYVLEPEGLFLPEHVVRSCPIPSYGNTIAYRDGLIYASDFDGDSKSGGSVIIMNATDCSLIDTINLSRLSTRGVFASPGDGGLFVMHHTGERSELWNTTLLLLDDTLETIRVTPLSPAPERATLNGFDVKGDIFCVSNADKNILIYSTNGTLLKTFPRNPNWGGRELEGCTIRRDEVLVHDRPYTISLPLKPYTYSFTHPLDPIDDQ